MLPILYDMDDTKNDDKRVIVYMTAKTRQQMKSAAALQGMTLQYAIEVACSLWLRGCGEELYR